MLRAVKTAMQVCALLIGAAVSIALNAMMPDVSWYKAWFYFLVCGLCFLFACTLAISSLLIGSAPGRSKLGSMLNTKVNQQTEGSADDYERKIRIAAKRNQAGP